MLKNNLCLRLVKDVSSVFIFSSVKLLYPVEFESLHAKTFRSFLRHKDDQKSILTFWCFCKSSFCWPANVRVELRHYWLTSCVNAVAMSKTTVFFSSVIALTLAIAGLLRLEAFKGSAILLLALSAICSSFAIFLCSLTDLDELALFFGNWYKIASVTVSSLLFLIYLLQIMLLLFFLLIPLKN